MTSIPSHPTLPGPVPASKPVAGAPAPPPPQPGPANDAQTLQEIEALAKTIFVELITKAPVKDVAKLRKICALAREYAAVFVNTRG